MPIYFVLSLIVGSFSIQAAGNCLKYFPKGGNLWPSQILLSKGLPVSEELRYVEGLLEEALDAPGKVFYLPHPLKSNVFTSVYFYIQPMDDDQSPYRMSVFKTLDYSLIGVGAMTGETYRRIKLSWLQLAKWKLQGKMGDLELARLRNSNDGLYQLEVEYVPGLKIIDLFGEEHIEELGQQRKIDEAGWVLLEKYDVVLRKILLLFEEKYSARNNIFIDPIEKVIDGKTLLYSVTVTNGQGGKEFDISPSHVIYDPIRNKLVLISPF